MLSVRERGQALSRAFTLIELLVVIAIIAILAAILFPVFAQAKLAAKKTAGISQMKQIGTALQIYASDYDDGAPTWNECLAYRSTFGRTPTECTVSGTFAPQFHWDSKLSPYVKNGKPENADWEGLWKSPGREGYVGRSLGMNQLAMWRPYSVQGAVGVPCSFGSGTSRFSGCYYWLRLGDVERTADIFFVADSGRAGRYEPMYFLNGYAERFVPTYAGYGAYDWGQPWRYGKHGANYTFLDSHAKFEPGDKMYPNPNHAPTLAFPVPVAISLYCNVIKHQAAMEETKSRLLNYVQTTLGGTCANL